MYAEPRCARVGITGVKEERCRTSRISRRCVTMLTHDVRNACESTIALITSDLLARTGGCGSFVEPAVHVVGVQDRQVQIAEHSADDAQEQRDCPQHVRELNKCRTN